MPRLSVIPATLFLNLANCKGPPATNWEIRVPLNWSRRRARRLKESIQIILSSRKWHQLTKNAQNHTFSLFGDVISRYIFIKKHQKLMFFTIFLFFRVSLVSSVHSSPWEHNFKNCETLSIASFWLTKTWKSVIKHLFRGHSSPILQFFRISCFLWKCISPSILWFKNCCFYSFSPVFCQNLRQYTQKWFSHFWKVTVLP